MSTHIHPTALVSQGAELGENVNVGPYSILEDGVVIGDGTAVSSSCLIKTGTRIGKDCKLFHGTVIGELPQDVRHKGDDSSCVIGDGNIIREYVTIHRATDEGGVTSVGDRNYLMAYVHVAHNCRIGNDVVIANATELAGYVQVDDYAMVSGLCPVHQFVRIGSHSMIAGGYRVPKDVPPFCLAAGDPLRVRGLNVVGLRRRNFEEQTLSILKEAFRILFRSSLNTTQALQKIKNGLPQIKEIGHLTQFIELSERGIIKGSQL